MQFRTLACFQSFRCLAGDCPDTCCAGWEIDLDAECLDVYRALPGTLGEEVREKLKQEDGESFFGLEQGKCPFLRDDGLCRLILAGGDELLSITCREHPRFREEYGDLQETCLAISCPEAARLLLEEPLAFCLRETAEEAPPDSELDEGLLGLLLRERERMFHLALADIPFARRLSLLEQQGQELQQRLDRSHYGEEIPTEPPALPDDLPDDRRDFLMAMCGMEFTDDRLKDLLSRTMEALPTRMETERRFAEFPREAENLLTYFLYRYILRAVWSGSLLEKVRFCTHAVTAIFDLASGFGGDFRQALREAAILFGRETEHNDDNLFLLYDQVGTETEYWDE